MHVVILTGGDLKMSRLVIEAIHAADLVLAADSGVEKARELGIIPKVVIGDMDSINKKTKRSLDRQAEFIISPIDKDETDTELAIVHAIKKGATEITLLGGIYGDRIDHVLGNIMYAVTCAVPMTFINGLQKTFIAKGPMQLQLEGYKNDLLSLVPIQGDVTGLESKGLKWELQNDTLVFGKPRGVSNVFLQQHITLSFTYGVVVITHTQVGSS